METSPANRALNVAAKLVVTACIGWVAWWLCGVYLDLLNGPEAPKRALATSNDLGPAPLIAEDSPAGFWSFPKLPWQIAAAKVQSEEEVRTRLTDTTEMNSSQAAFGELTADWKTWLKQVGSQEIVAGENRTIHYVEQGTQRIALLVHGDKLVGLRLAIQVPNEGWTLFAAQSSGQGDSTANHLMPLPDGATIEGVRSDAAGLPILQIVSLPTLELPALYDRWTRDGWRVVPVRQDPGETTRRPGSAMYACERQGKIVNVLLQRISDEKSSALFWVAPVPHPAAQP